MLCCKPGAARSALPLLHAASRQPCRGRCSRCASLLCDQLSNTGSAHRIAARLHLCRSPSSSAMTASTTLKRARWRCRRSTSRRQVLAQPCLLLCVAPSSRLWQLARPLAPAMSCQPGRHVGVHAALHVRLPLRSRRPPRSLPPTSANPAAPCCVAVCRRCTSTACCGTTRTAWPSRAAPTTPARGPAWPGACDGCAGPGQGHAREGRQGVACVRPWRRGREDCVCGQLAGGLDS